MRWPGLGRFAADLFGHADRRLIAIVDAQIDAAIEGTVVAREVVTGRLPAAEARRQMKTIEHRGDNERARLVTALSSTLTAPIDREDLFRLSRCIDDVLDCVRDFVRESDLYGLGEQPGVTPVLEALIEGLHGLATANQTLLSSHTEPSRATRQIERAAGQVRRCYQVELAELFNGPLDIRLLKRRELLRRLDVAGLRLGEAADALADGLVKRGR